MCEKRWESKKKEREREVKEDKVIRWQIDSKKKSALV